MKQLILSVVAGMQFAGSWAFAHPSSGIAVNDKGEVFFVHTGKGLGKVDAQGKLTYVHQSRGGHWMCLDRLGSFSRTQPKFFERVTPEGAKPVIIFADGGAPLAVCRDGNLYYGSFRAKGDEHKPGYELRVSDNDHQPGGSTVSRMSPDGKLSHFTPQLEEMLKKRDEGVTGLAAGSDGALYVASPGGIFKVKMDGNVSAFAEQVTVKDCDEDLPPNWRAPGFRGLSVATNGTVFAAATGCHCVVSVMPQGEVKNILKSERPWSPTDVALHGSDAYVLEWANPNVGPDAGWRPRVRKVARDGKVTTLVTIEENLKPPR
jgi:sugar lactone lactonase YvrE